MYIPMKHSYCFWFDPIVPCILGYHQEFYPMIGAQCNHVVRVGADTCGRICLQVEMASAALREQNAHPSLGASLRFAFFLHLRLHKPPLNFSPLASSCYITIPTCQKSPTQTTLLVGP